MGKDIRKHVQECDACQCTKPSNHLPTGRLHPLPISGWPWESIGMDYLGPVPKSTSGKDTILIAIDRLTKMARFIPTHSSVTSKETADLFLREVFRHHGLPSNIVSDREPRFTAKFWEALQKALGVELLMSTAAHPQTDGQAEAAVKVIQKLLKPFVFQEQDWEDLLPSLEFAYNDTVQSSTSQTPFYLNYGHHPTGVTWHEPVNNPHAEDQVRYLLHLQEAARDAINDAQQVQHRNTDRKRNGYRIDHRRRLGTAEKEGKRKEEICPDCGWTIPSHQNRNEYRHTPVPLQLSSASYSQHFQSTALF